MTCPYCRGHLEGGAVCCQDCGTWLHGECALDHGGCTTFGCQATRFQGGVPTAARRPLSPALPPSVSLRRAVRGLVEVALAPREDLALAILSAAGGLAMVVVACGAN